MSLAFNYEYLKRDHRELQFKHEILEHEKKVLLDVIYELQERIKRIESGHEWQSVRLQEVRL